QPRHRSEERRRSRPFEKEKEKSFESGQWVSRLYSSASLFWRIRTRRRASSARLCDGAVTVVVTTAEKAFPGAATMSPETFSILSVARAERVALKRSVRVTVKFSSAPARTAASISTIPRARTIQRPNQSERFLASGKSRGVMLFFITERDAVFRMKLPGSTFHRLST